MGVKVKFNSNWDKFKNDPMAFAEQFPCPSCGTVSKRIEGDMMFHCPKENVDFHLDVNYVSSDQDPSNADTPRKK